MVQGNSLGRLGSLENVSHGEVLLHANDALPIISRKETALLSTLLGGWMFWEEAYEWEVFEMFVLRPESCLMAHRCCVNNAVRKRQRLAGRFQS